ncbi:hypothetical protein CYMTET_23574 [Cymbomonas tetramitiformis]|uniref:Fe2OG dioxygenase domain-containing protein n=1 Tax=Cymbomonas tetramitiformis TaxID=36881 RepID=A0AAE0FXP4_9CHLO|nr:hypothetical protein CYMTET_23574 [Cymbomonas tetramitiformis]
MASRQCSLDSFYGKKTEESGEVERSTAKRKSARPANGSKALRACLEVNSFVTCPVCQQRVPHTIINIHLDSGCEASAGSIHQKGSAEVSLTRKSTEPTSSNKFGVHTGLKGGWRPSHQNVLDILDEADKADTPDSLHAGPAYAPIHQERESSVQDDDEACKAASESRQVGSLRKAPMLRPSVGATSGLPGHFVLDNFISEEEEALILRCLDEDPENRWAFNSFNGNSRGKRYGVECDLVRRITKPPRFQMPDWLQVVMQRMREVGPPVLADFHPNECNAIDYRRDEGHELLAHCDDRQMSGDVICNLSLAGDCKMTYTKEKGGFRKVDVSLPRRSLQVQAGGVRYDYMHGITNDHLFSERRVSITFRESKIQSRPLYEGARYVSMKNRFKWGQKL